MADFRTVDAELMRLVNLRNFLENLLWSPYFEFLFTVHKISVHQALFTTVVISGNYIKYLFIFTHSYSLTISFSCRMSSAGSGSKSSLYLLRLALRAPRRKCLSVHTYTNIHKRMCAIHTHTQTYTHARAQACNHTLAMALHINKRPRTNYTQTHNMSAVFLFNYLRSRSEWHCEEFSQKLLPPLSRSGYPPREQLSAYAFSVGKIRRRSIPTHIRTTQTRTLAQPST